MVMMMMVMNLLPPVPLADRGVHGKTSSSFFHGSNAEIVDIISGIAVKRHCQIIVIIGIKACILYHHKQDKPGKIISNSDHHPPLNKGYNKYLINRTHIDHYDQKLSELQKRADRAD